MVSVKHAIKLQRESHTNITKQAKRMCMGLVFWLGLGKVANFQQEDVKGKNNRIEGTALRKPKGKGN